MRAYLTLIALAFLVYVVSSRSIPSSSNEDIVDDLAQEANYHAEQLNEDSEDDDDDSNKRRQVIAEDNDDEEENDSDNGSRKVSPSSEDEDDLVNNFHVDSVQAETTKSSTVANVESESDDEEDLD